MFIQTEITPNPSTLKFIPENKVLDKGSYEFKSKEEAKSSQLASDLFSNKAVTNVFFGLDFITITKSESFSSNISRHSGGERVMISGACPGRESRSLEGTQAVTRPVPFFKAPMEASMAAPAIPEEPQTVKRCPKSPLCDSNGLRGRSFFINAGLESQVPR